MEESKSSLKKWSNLSAKEEENRLNAIASLLKEHGLTQIVPLSADHQVNLLKSGLTQKQSKLLITGTVEASLAQKVKTFEHRVKKEILEDINPYTFLVRIDVKPPVAAEPFTKCVGLKNLATGENHDLEAVEGKALLINFWALNCDLSMKIAQSFAGISQAGITEARVININVDEIPEEPAKAIAAWGPHENYHVGSSAADLIYRTSMIPRALLVDIKGNIAFCGHPMKIDL